MSENTAVVTKKEPGMASLVIVLFAISAITALVLGLVNMVTAPQIAINTQKKTDEEKLRKRNTNSSLNSAHQYGTTFDVSWVRYTKIDENTNI